MGDTKTIFNAEEYPTIIQRSFDSIFSVVSIFNICERWAQLTEETEDR